MIAAKRAKQPAFLRLSFQTVQVSMTPANSEWNMALPPSPHHLKQIVLTPPQSTMAHPNPLVAYHDSASSASEEDAAPTLTAPSHEPTPPAASAAPPSRNQMSSGESRGAARATSGATRAAVTARVPHTADMPGAGGDMAADMPPELRRELRRGGHALDDVTFVDVDARLSAATRVRGGGEGAAKSSAVAARAGRIAKKAGVSRAERRKHQITALAADAAALAAARHSLGVSEGGRRGKRK